MADINKIRLPNGSAYDLKDASARASCALLSSTKADISSVSRVFIKDPDVQEYANGKQSDLSVIKLSYDEYIQLVVDDETQPNAEYILSGDNFDNFGQQIKNVAPGTELSDAAIVEQVNAVSSQLSGKEDVSNKVTALLSTSTDDQYPTAKCMYDIIGSIESALDIINNGGAQ